MGSWLSNLWKSWSTSKLVVLCVGLSGSGKTTLTRSMRCEKCENVKPTISLDIQNFKHEGVQVKVWDCGGQEVFRNSWASYLKQTGCDCMMFVIDAYEFRKDKVHRKTVKRELRRMLKICQEEKKTVLIVCNKIDLPGHASTDYIQRELDVATEFSGMFIIMTETSATKGIGIPRVLKWLVKVSDE